MRGCEHCSALLLRAEKLLQTFADARGLSHPPKHLLQRVLQAILSESDASAPAAGMDLPAETATGDDWWQQVRAGLREVIAELIADSVEPSPVLRGVASAEPRMLLYETDAFSITLSLKPGQSPATRDWIGQVAPRGSHELPPEGQAILRREGRQKTVWLSAYGEFAFREEPEGVSELSIAVGEYLVHLPLPEDQRDG
jgi:hypothetical protein